MAKTALITGITGQDGAYLAKLLLEKGYEVHGAYRRSASFNVWRLAELGIEKEVKLVPMDLLEFSNVLNVVDKIKPDEVYNLAAQSFVAISFEQPIYTCEVDGLGVTRLLEALRKGAPHARFYQASTSEMFGKVREVPQTEKTPFHPRSPYGVAKLYGHWITVNYREAYDMYACSGILFNHESPLRGAEFVTRKITRTLAQIKNGLAETLHLGNLDAKRDWGFAGDYVDGIYRMLQHDSPEDFVLSTGSAKTVREFVDYASQVANMKIEWHGEGANESGVDTITGKTVVQVRTDFYRPAEVELLLGDSSLAREKLGWEPNVSFHELAEMMMEADLRRVQSGAFIN